MQEPESPFKPTRISLQTHQNLPSNPPLQYPFLPELNTTGVPLTNDEENFWRLVRILLDDVPNKLREMFKSNCLRQEES